MNNSTSWEVRWDYYSVQESPKSGRLDAINSSHALFRSSELIDERRWLRLRVGHSDLSFLVIARVLKRDAQLSARNPKVLTRYLYTLEFTHSLSEELLNTARAYGIFQSEILHSPRCVNCGEKHAKIPLLDLVQAESESENGAPRHRESPVQLLCLQCHLRRSASRYLNPAALPSPHRELIFTSLS